MNGKRLLFILLLISLKVSGQNNYALKGDYADAVNLNIHQKYTFPASAKGFGKIQEYPINKARSRYLFEKERNTCWFSLSVENDGFLTFDIIPFSASDDYDWMLFKEITIGSGNSRIDYNKPIRTNNSRNDGTIAGKTGLKEGFFNLFTAPGPGKSYSKPISVYKGENYILVVDNIYPGGKGFTFSSQISKTLSPPISNSLMSGFITDKESMLPLQAAITVEDTAGKMVAGTVSDSLTGKFSFKVPPEDKLMITISKKGYVLVNDFLSVKTVWQQNYQLQKLKEGARIIFYNIHFLPNSPAIVNTSGTDLNNLLTFLQEEKNWKIQIIGHTNSNVFTDEHYLQQLSERRAWAVKTFLLQHGIANNRIRCFGLGGKNPLYDNKKPEEAVKNLRVEIVLEK
ncbi:OmpA family protein [Mucilaginibacter arboris]|uniref:OmpA family protein n=1 Tax=Mucilaginibacter arboris TaxID=2682090 RepID=A0A7K1SSJ5_9SPHI|nr:OmpA family protein [Mucilaginibacter arboris]MVN20217.1 OmpA family protein [Mucilaginibacter arboris]